MITTGVTGNPWRASITPWGAIHPWDEGEGPAARPLDWYVAAEDRWHVPSQEPTVRQRRIDGTAVVETRVRVPTGDVVQRIASVADGPGYTVVEVENDSTLPVAVAFDRRDVRTERPVSELPAVPPAELGLELPSEAFVVPIGHRAVARVAIAHDGSGAGQIPPLPTAQQVARGWTALTERASRMILPGGDAGEGLALEVTAQRCELALGSMAHAADDPAAFAVGLGELVRMGEQPSEWLPELAHAVELMASRQGWEIDAALEAADRVLAAAGERRAQRDLARIIERRGAVAEARPTDRPDGVMAIVWAEQRLAHGGALLPEGMPPTWLGVNFEVYGVPVGSSSTVSYAIRWHGERPAVLWEVTGDPVELTSPALDPAWRTSVTSGEALWPPPPSPTFS